jgi:hypothetical protein
LEEPALASRRLTPLCLLLLLVVLAAHLSLSWVVVREPRESSWTLLFGALRSSSKAGDHIVVRLGKMFLVEAGRLRGRVGHYYYYCWCNVGRSFRSFKIVIVMRVSQVATQSLEFVRYKAFIPLVIVW